MNALRHAVSEFWRQRQARERTFLSISGMVIGAVLIYAVLIDPALVGRQRLQKSLPALREQAGALDELLLQAKALPVTTPSLNAPLTREAVEQNLRHKGLTATNIVGGDGTIKIEFDTLAFASLVDCLTEMQQTAHWQVEIANAVAQPGVGMVKANVTLRQP